MPVQTVDLVELVHDLNLETRTDTGPECPFRLVTDGFEWVILFIENEAASSEEHSLTDVEELRAQVLSNVRELITDWANIKLPEE